VPLYILSRSYKIVLYDFGAVSGARVYKQVIIKSGGEVEKE